MKTSKKKIIKTLKKKGKVNNMNNNQNGKLNNSANQDVSYKWQDPIEQAQEYANELAEENKKNETDFLYLSHVGADGSTLKIRLEEKDYQVVYCVENIAHLKGNESMVIDHWMNSPTACNNIMNRQVTAMGMARSGDYWVLLFAQPKKK